jgi:putative ABC transport system substrate-binding protein
VIEFAAAQRLPAIYEFDLIVREGGLTSYSMDLDESFERVAALIDRIFKGAKPAELPCQQPNALPFRSQSQDRKGSWHYSPTVAAHPG